MKKKVKDKIGMVVWAVSTFDSEAEIIKFCREKVELTAKETEEAIEEARRRIRDAADFDLTYEIGRELTKNDYLYKQAVKMQDLKTAAKTQRDRWILLGLEKAAKGAAGGEVIEYDADAAELEIKLDNIRAQLEALEIAPAGLAIEDLTRRVVVAYLEMEKKTICRSPDTQGPDTETPRRLSAAP